MIGFGDKLRREREMRGVSLEEIAESTKIGTRSLRALEEDEFDKLPGGIFNRGFVRAYSRFLGLDEEQTVADFDAALKEYNTANGRVEELPVVVESEPESFRALWLIAAAVVLIAAISSTGFFLIRHTFAAKAVEREAKSEPASQAQPIHSLVPPSSTDAAGSANPVVTAASQPPKERPSSQPKSTPSESASGSNAASSPSSETSSSEESASTSGTSPIRLLVVAREESWLSVSADGRNLGQQTLAAQESRTINAQKEVRLKLGNVGGVEVSFNGKPVNIDGEPRQVKEFTFTPDGLHQ